MRARWWVVMGAAATTIAVVGLRGAGLSARRTAWPGEAGIARTVRSWLLPAADRSRRNPLTATPAVIRAGMEHWADHCASCHGNDGRGHTALGRAMFPPAPDMSASPTQAQSDGALFYAIEQGIPFTGMPAWSTGTPEGERSSWELVRFIRHLPNLRPEEIEEMERLNPKSAADIARDREIEEFLGGASR